MDVCQTTPLLVINLNVVCLKHNSHVGAQRYILFVQTNGKKETRGFLVDSRTAEKNVIIASKAFTDFKINPTTQWWR